MKKTLGAMITELRKEHKMTQMELAEKMGVTDKAVSKWERDLSYPDINSLPNLATILDVTVDDLMQLKKGDTVSHKSIKEIIDLILKAVALGMGIAVVVLSILNSLATTSAVLLLGIGLTCLSISMLNNQK